MARRKPVTPKENNVDENTPSSPETVPAAPVESTPNPSQEAPPVQSTPEPTPPYGVTNVESLTNIPHHDDTDVAAALARVTQDGKGPDPIPESDFDSFATEGVNKGELSDEALALEVLSGMWGHGEERRALLSRKGYDPSAVAKIVNRHLATGAPYKNPTSVKDDATAVIRGEWGDQEEEVRSNLRSANKNVDEVMAEVRSQLGL